MAASHGTNRLRMTLTMDKGSWTFMGSVGYNGILYSDDFENDVTIRVCGDFADDEHRKQYCEWLVGVLNAAGSPRTPAGCQESK